jgi:chemotaxis protein histidine kinase CheA
MVHALKFVGLALLIILALILAILACVLFIPITWRAEVRKGKSFVIKAKVAWAIAKYELEMADGKNSQSLSALWFKLGQEKKKKKKAKKKKADKPPNKEAAIDEAKPAPAGDEAPPKREEAEPKAAAKEKKPKKAKEENPEEKKTLKSRIEWIRAKWDMISEFPLKDELLEETGKLIKRLIKAIIPKGLEGELELGFDDPSLTGKVLGALYFITGVGGFSNFRFRADFEKTKFTADLKAWGRISIWSLMWPALAAALSKPGRYILKPLIFKNRIKNRKDVGHEQQLEQQS